MALTVLPATAERGLWIFGVKIFANAFLLRMLQGERSSGPDVTAGPAPEYKEDEAAKLACQLSVGDHQKL